MVNMSFRDWLAEQPAPMHRPKVWGTGRKPNAPATISDITPKPLAPNAPKPVKPKRPPGGGLLN